MATRRDLCEAVLKKVDVLGAGQTSSAEDIDAVDREIDGAMQELRRYVVHVSNYGRRGDLTSGDIDPAFLDALACFMVQFVNFGQSTDYSAMQASLGTSRLRAMQADKQTDEPIRFLAY